MREKRYQRLVRLCVYFLQATMVVIAVAIPVVCSIDSSVLNKIVGKAIPSPHAYCLFELAYSEIVLGYILSLFINFKKEEIFISQNTGYLRSIGKLIIIRDFAYIPVNLVANGTLTVNFNVCAWLIGYILILFSYLLDHGIQMREAQEYTV